MAITIDFTAETIVGNYCLGRIGEHNATELLITVPTSLSGDSRTASYRVAFHTGKSQILSTTFTSSPINIKLWKQLTAYPRISIQVIAYDTDGEYIGKSQKLSGFYFEPSIDGTEVTADGSNQDMAGEISALATRLTTAEGLLDSHTVRKDVPSDAVFTDTVYDDTELTAAVEAKYTKPATGIPASDLASGVIPTVPTKTSDLTNDSGFITSDYHDSTKQNTLTAGTNITITNDVISASGGDVIYTELYDEDYETSGHFTLYTGNEIRTMWNAKTPMCYKGYPIVDLADATSAVVIYWVQSASTNTQVILKRKTINNSEYGTIYEYDNLYNFVNPSAKIDNPSTKSSGQVLTYNGSTWEAQTLDADDIAYSSTKSVNDKFTDLDDAIDGKAENNQDIQGETKTVNAWISSLLSQKANKSDLVTSISSSSTDTQYPSAKCVYDAIGDVNTAIASINALIGGAS